MSLLVYLLALVALFLVACGVTRAGDDLREWARGPEWMRSGSTDKEGWD